VFFTRRNAAFRITWYFEKDQFLRKMNHEFKENKWGIVLKRASQELLGNEHDRKGYLECRPKGKLG